MCPSPFIGVTYYYTTIEKIDGLAPGSIRELCGIGPVPAGWIVIRIEGECRIIEKIQGLAPGTSIDICGNIPVPPGWITSNIGGICQTSGTTVYYTNTITRVENLPIDAMLTICSNDPVPECWILVSTGDICRIIGGTNYYIRTIKKISNNATCDPVDNSGRCCIVHNDGTTDCKVTASGIRMPDEFRIIGYSI